jgi:uncharacterized protein
MIKGESNVCTLIKNMYPKTDDKAFVFITQENFPFEYREETLMFFKEKEGYTLLIEEKIAQKRGCDSKNKWAKITLCVHSDLHTIGFLSVLLSKLAEAKISVNPVLAYFQDHLFVPWEKRKLAIKILKMLASD